MSAKCIYVKLQCGYPPLMISYLLGCVTCCWVMLAMDPLGGLILLLGWATSSSSFIVVFCGICDCVVPLTGGLWPATLTSLPVRVTFSPAPSILGLPAGVSRRAEGSLEPGPAEDGRASFEGLDITVEMLVQLECTQFSQFISHSHDIPFQSSNQTAQVEYPELCSTGVHRIFTVFHRERTAPSWYYSPSFSVISLPSCPSVSLLTERVQTSAGKRTRRRERRRRNEGEGVNHHLSKRSLQRSEVYACAPRDD